jgi:hypothetical protein
MDEPGVRLVVLGPDKPHLAKSDSSAALTAAAELLDRRGSAAREHRNGLVFLAADHKRLEELERAAADALAWTSVVAEAGADGLNLDPNQTKQATTKSDDATRTVALRLAETWHWVLVPEQHDPTGPITWEAVRVDGSDGLAVRAGRKLVDRSLVYERFNPSQIRMALDGHLSSLWQDGHVSAGRLWDTFARYLYLPKLTDQRILLDAIADGPASMVWQTDGFALADTYDDQAGRYLGLRTGERATATAATLLVRPDRAMAQREAEPRTDPDGPNRHDVDDPGEVPIDEEDVNGQPRRYWATVDLDPERLVRDFGVLNQELISHLSRLDGATVRVHVQVEATSDDGFDEATIRTVTENARTLKITDSSFEER